MGRYLVQVDLARLEEIKRNLAVLRASSQVKPIEQVMDYLVIDVPPELAPKVEAIMGVVRVAPESWLSIKQVLIPIDEKIAEFQRLFLSNPITGPPSAFSYSAKVDAGIDRWATGESRKVLGADVAEKDGITGKNIKVAVIDTGATPCAQGHYLEPNSKSSVDGMPVPWDENGHGTWCASCISGNAFSTPFGLLKGMAPDCEVGVFKCLGYLVGAGTESSVMRAMMDAFQWKADILSMSLGSAYSDEPANVIPECRAIHMLTNAGVIIVVANGNDATEEKIERTVGVPACEPSALSVGAIDKNGNRASFSSCGPTQDGLIKPDLAAPGVFNTSSSTGLIALMQAGRDWVGTASISGTSMATPHVAGWCALVKQLYRKNGIDLTTAMIKNMMERYGKPKDNFYGWGIPTWDIAKKYLSEVLGR